MSKEKETKKKDGGEAEEEKVTKKIDIQITEPKIKTTTIPSNNKQRKKKIMINTQKKY